MVRRGIVLAAILIHLASGFPCYGQSPDTLADSPGIINEQLLEDYLQNAETDADFDFNTIFENLAHYRDKPLHINKADADAWRELGLLSEPQLQALLDYRQRLGGFISLYELQAVPGLDLPTIQQLLPYLTLGAGGDLDDYQISLKQLHTDGRREIYLRWARTLERQRGYLGDDPAFLGDPSQLYFRYRHTHGRQLSYGLTAEKDRGEAWRWDRRQRGFDFYSAHWFLRDYKKWLPALTVGDYGASFGQGLILYSGFGYGKNALTTHVQRGGRPLRPYTSANEAGFLRGVATTIELAKRWQLTTLFSLRRRDANLLLDRDTFTDRQAALAFSAFRLDGLHRTAAELADKNAIQHLNLGGSLRRSFGSGHVALNAVYHRLDQPLSLRPRLYNRFYFQGDRLLNLSLDYQWRYRNLNLFGETAHSDNGAVATLNGLQVTLDPKLDVALLFRHYPRHFHTLFADPFAETGGGRNETGLYLGLEWRPNTRWRFNAYVDSWRHPWLRYRVDAPSRGWDYRLRLSYHRRRGIEAYVEYRYERKEQNATASDQRNNLVLPVSRRQARLHLSYPLTKTLEWRSRLDWGRTDSPTPLAQNGLAFYQDLLFRPIGFPLSFTTRFSLFDTDGYDVRFYSYENGLLYNFAVPAYYQQGSRFYLNLRYKLGRSLVLEARYAQLYWSNQPFIGSGNDATLRPTRTEVGVQVRWQF